MSDDLILTYLTELRKYEIALREIEAVTKTVGEAADALRSHPLGFYIADIKAVEFEVESVLNPVSVSANDWPDARKLAKKLAALQVARRRTIAAYVQIPEADRAGRPAPPR